MSEFEIYQERMIEHEIAAAGAVAFGARENYSILIHGENRIAHNLLAILLGSGFKKVQIITANKLLPAHIEHADFNALSVTNENLGERRSATHSRIARSASLFATSENGASEPFTHLEPGRIRDPDLIISTSRAQGDYRQRWMSESSTHLHIDCDKLGYAWIGPLVIPGVHPCLNCSDLHQRDRRNGEGIAAHHLGVRQELSVSSAALVAATVAIEVSNFAATGESSLIGLRHPISLRAPIVDPESPHSHRPLMRVLPQSRLEEHEAVQRSGSRQFFDFHPECGCVGDQLSS